MKIVDIRTTPLSYRCDPPYGSAGGMQARRGGLLVEIETDERVIGIGEAGVGGGITRDVIDKLLQPMLIGEDPLLIEGLWQKMFARTRQFGRRGIVMNAISGIDIALWDIAGKVAKLPLYRLLGGCRDRVEAYASGGFYQEGKSADDLAGEAEGYRARGFKGMKMKIGRNPSTQTHLRHLVDHAELCEVDPEEDIARVAAVRRALGPQAKLMADVNCAWSPSFAIEMGRALEPYQLYWIEEPVATDDIDGSARVADALATPIAGYETEIGLYGFRELITRGAVDIVQPDIAWAGGFSECRRIAALAQAHHLMVAPHAFASAVTLAASLHFIASIPNGLVLEFDQNPNGLRDELLKEPIRYRARRHDQIAGAAGPRDRARSRRSRALPRRMSARLLYTIGYEKTLLKDVVSTLAAARVATLIDVRDRPISRRPGFSKRQLAAAIEEAGMRYIHLEALGTPPEGRLAGRRREWDRFWGIVEEKLARPEAELALQEAAEIAEAAPSCLLCYEADWQICHRRRVAEILAQRHGFGVSHLAVGGENDGRTT